MPLLIKIFIKGAEMSRYIETAEKHTLPVIALEGVVAFPGIALSFEATDDASCRAAEAAFESDSNVLLLTLKDPSIETITPDAFFKVGTVAKIKQSVKTPEGGIRIIAEGFSRAGVLEIRQFADYYVAEAISKQISFSSVDDIKSEAYNRAILTEVDKLVKLLPSVSDDIMNAARSIKDPALLSDFIASNILVKYADKLEILKTFEPVRRIELLISLLREEATLLSYELGIHKKVRENLARHQKEFYLREQLGIIQDELGEGANSEIGEYTRRVLEAELPKEVEEKLLVEIDRMAKTPFGSSEASVMRSHLDVCIELPWTKLSKERCDIAAAKKILDDDHDGLTKVKERILEYLAVKQLNPELRNQIICLVGPPGVGKTSIGASIARATKRKYVRVSLGGIRDEADIRGHRKTYVGAMPGRIINALSQAGTRNPLILLDEIDKVTRDAHGDPSSALLEVLDAEQNKAFRDHFVEIPFDLSECMFIATANTLDTIPRPLLDRMEVIELSTYTKTEKTAIAKNHLIPKQLKRHGLNKRMLKISDDAITEIIDYYTREAGVRNLERTIAELARKAAKALVDEPERKSVSVTAKNLSTFLGKRKMLPERIADEDEIGTVNGLAYTSAGGDMLKVEVAILDGTGKIELTGSLGDVMKESANIAVSYVRSIAASYGIATDFYKTKDIHIHFPEGAVPKDGPSAGVTMVTALVSALAGRKVRRDVAMTGEISLRGKVLPIGGLKEKTMAAYSAGINTVLIPADNEKDLENIDPAAREALNFVFCKSADDVLRTALVENTEGFAHKTKDCRDNTKNKNGEDLSDYIPSVMTETTSVSVNA